MGFIPLGQHGIVTRASPSGINPTHHREPPHPPYKCLMKIQSDRCSNCPMASLPSIFRFVNDGTDDELRVAKKLHAVVNFRRVVVYDLKSSVRLTLICWCMNLLHRNFKESGVSS